MNKRIFSLMLVLLLVVVLLPVSAHATTITGNDADDGFTLASTTYTSGYWTYELYDSTAKITAYSGNEANVTIPSTVTYMGTTYKVTELANYLFENKAMSTVIIPQYITYIGDCAFKNCKYLTKITINAKNLDDCSDYSDNSYYDGYSVFYSAGAESSSLSVVFGSGVTRIPAYLFSTAGSKSDNTYAHITSVTIPDSVLAIGESAFKNCFDLKSVTWGNNIQTIGWAAFEYCYALQSVTIPASATSIGDRAFKECRALTSINFNAKNLNDCSNYSDDSYYDGYSVFYNAGVNSSGLSVTFGSTVKEIPAYLFSTGADYNYGDGTYAHITSVTMDSSVTKIGECAFKNCFDLKSITWGSNIQTIGWAAFEYCYALQSVTIPASATSIGDRAFKECRALTSINFNAKNLNDCSNYSDDSYYDGYSVFYNAGVNSSGLSVTFGSTVKEIPAYLFSTGADYNYGDGTYAHITSVTIADSVAEIGAYAFNNCFDLSDVYYAGSPEQWSEIVIGSNNDCLLDATMHNTTPSTLKILQQPQDAYTQLGKKINISVVAEGEGLTYDWYVKDVVDTEYVLSSIKSSTYAPTMTEDKAGRYAYCVITDKYGNSVRTNTVRMWLTATITKQPVSVTVAEGQTARVTVQAVGDGLTYRWYYKNVGESKYTYTSSFKSNTYSVTMNEARNGRQVLCRVYDKYGNVVQTKTVTLSMVASTLKITQQPVSVTVAEGETAKVTVKATGDGLTYRWYYKNVGDGSYSYTSSYKGNTYSVPMNAARNGRQVLCRVYDKYGNVVQTNTVKLSMAASTLKITQQPVSVTVAEGETAKVTVKATGDGLTYRWYYKNAGDSSYTYTSSYTGNTYSVTMNASRNGRQVLCRVYDKYGNVVQSNTVTLKMEATTASVREITWKDITAGSTYNSSQELTGFLLNCMFTCDPHSEDGFTVENSFGGAQGHMPFFVDGSGYNYMYFSFYIPNDSSLEGWHTVTLYHDGVSDQVKFYLDYLGDYSHIVGTSQSTNGLGWKVTEWMPLN